MRRIQLSDLDKKALQFMLGDNWAVTPYSSIPYIVNQKVGFGLLHLQDTLTNALLKICDYYLNHEAGRK